MLKNSKILNSFLVATIFQIFDVEWLLCPWLSPFGLMDAAKLEASLDADN